MSICILGQPIKGKGEMCLEFLELVHDVVVDGFPASSQLLHALVLFQVLKGLGFRV